MLFGDCLAMVCRGHSQWLAIFTCILSHEAMYFQALAHKIYSINIQQVVNWLLHVWGVNNELLFIYGVFPHVYHVTVSIVATRHSNLHIMFDISECYHSSTFNTAFVCEVHVCPGI